MVCKKDMSMEPFDRNKLMNGLIKACHKRPVSVRQMEKIVEGIELDYANNFRTEVSTS